jgi:hypothetical protein
MPRIERPRSDALKGRAKEWRGPGARICSELFVSLDSGGTRVTTAPRCRIFRNFSNGHAYTNESKLRSAGRLDGIGAPLSGINVHRVRNHALIRLTYTARNDPLISTELTRTAMGRE